MADEIRTTTKGRRAPDPEVEETKLRRAEHYVRKMLTLQNTELPDNDVMEMARKVAKVSPPYAFRGRYMS